MEKIEVAFNEQKLYFVTRLESGYDVTVTDEIVIKEIFVENVYETEISDIEGKVVLDIGANIGAYSIYAAACGATKVYAFEPDSDNFEILKQNVINNGFEDIIELHNKALYNKTGKVELYRGQGASFIKGNKTPTPEAKAILDSGIVPTQTIDCLKFDTFLKDIIEIDICKIDIEGSEYKLIIDSSTEQLKKLKMITAEFHSTSDQEYGLLLAKLSYSHNVHVFGKANLGGQLIAKVY